MNNRTMRFSLGAIAVGAITLLAQNGQSQTTTYNNTTGNTSTDFNFNNAQAGNEIIQAGFATGDDITSFAFQYDFLNSTLGTTGTPAGGETATLSFYNNWGPTGATKVSGYTVPQSPALFTSSAVSIAGGFTTGQTITFTAANGGLPSGGVDVPQIFTWTVTFAGIATSTETAGLALYNPPTTGQNYSDAWYNSAGSTTPSWQLDVASSGGTPLQFGATVSAVPEPSTLGMFAMGSIGLLASGWRKLRR
jgi:hypothetical protein